MARTKKMTDEELNELTHIVSDFLDRYLPSGKKVDRYVLNDLLEDICYQMGVERDE